MSRRSSNSVEKKNQNNSHSKEESKKNKNDLLSSPMNESPLASDDALHLAQVQSQARAPLSPTTLASIPKLENYMPSKLVRQVAQTPSSDEVNNAISAHQFMQSINSLNLQFDDKAGEALYRTLLAVALKVWKLRFSNKIRELSSKEGYVMRPELKTDFDELYVAEVQFSRSTLFKTFGKWTDKARLIDYPVQNRWIIAMFHTDEELLKLVQGYLFMLKDYQRLFTEEPFIHPLEQAIQEYYEQRSNRYQNRFYKPAPKPNMDQPRFITARRALQNGLGNQNEVSNGQSDNGAKRAKLEPQDDNIYEWNNKYIPKFVFWCV